MVYGTGLRFKMKIPNRKDTASSLSAQYANTIKCLVWTLAGLPVLFKSGSLTVTIFRTIQNDNAGNTDFSKLAQKLHRIELHRFVSLCYGPAQWNFITATDREGGRRGET